jgi:hypothetical protein
MSRRVMADGRTYDRSTTTKVREYHRPVPNERETLCAECGCHIHFVRTGHTPTAEGIQGHWRHDPGTFWEAS